jgi:hypothetical protein
MIGAGAETVFKAQKFLRLFSGFHPGEFVAKFYP